MTSKYQQMGLGWKHVPIKNEANRAGLQGAFKGQIWSQGGPTKHNINAIDL